jgi:hypothetical protein
MSVASPSIALNEWAPSPQRHVPAVLMQPIDDPAAWTARDFAGRDAWLYRLSGDEVDEVLAAVAAVERAGLPLMDVTRENFPLPRFGETLRAIRDEAMLGRGFAVLRGLPVEGRTRLQVATAFWGMGAWLGRAISQNRRGHLLGHVKDTGGDYSVGRGYNTSAALAFHSDRCDMLSLCCLQPARSGGAHRIASSVTIYNTLLARRPDLVRELTWPFYRSRRGEIPDGETTPWFRLPVFSVTDGYFAARPPGSVVMKAQGMPGVPELMPLQREALEAFAALARENALDIDLEPGDVSYLQNFVTLHARTSYEDHPEPERKRHLLRLWLDTGGVRPLADDIRREVTGVAVPPELLETPLDAA